MKTLKLLIIAMCVALLCACSSSDNGGGSAYGTLATIGGTGTNGSGGNGGNYYIESDAAIRVLASGAANPTFTMPAASSYNLGSNGYTVSGNEEIILDTAAPANYAGLYMISNQWLLYKADGTGGAGSPNLDYTVSGLRVPAGATLTINADNNLDGGSPAGAYLEFNNDVIINGTLKTGTGYHFIYFDNQSSYSNNIVVTGTVTTSGASNGFIDFEVGNSFYNSGTIDASGGYNATTGNGYDSGYIYIIALTGSVYSSGTLRANGGNGGNGYGGAVHSIMLIGGGKEDNSVNPVNGGSVIVSGVIEARGGNAGGTTGGNGGGVIGRLAFWAMGGDMIVNASFNSNGGNAAGSGNTGGTASGAEFYCYGEDYRNVGVCQISGSFNMAGGNGETGGQGGYVEVYSWAYNHSGAPPPINELGQAPNVELLGFYNINVGGGNGTTQGGTAGYYKLYTYASWNDYDSYWIPAYPIISEANVTAKGGNASAAGGTGGQGGYVELTNDYDEDYGYSPVSTVTQSGTIDISGGNATAAGGTGGNSSEAIFLGSDNNGYCWNVTTTGKLIAKGGNGALQGGYGGYIDLYSGEIPTVYTLSNLSVTGGTGTTPGISGSAWVDSTQVLP